MSTSYCRSYGVCFLALLLSFALVLLPALACAEDGVNNAAASSEASEPNSKQPAVGSITLLLTGEANGSGAMMIGGEISLYRVASISREDSHNRFYDASSGQFASSEAVAGIRSMSKQELDAQNPTISKVLHEEVVARGVEPLQTVAIVDGKASFPKVEEGLYLIVQTEPGDAQRQVQPFVMSVPDDQGELEVVATPKPGAWDGVDPNASKEQQEDSRENDDGKRTTPATTNASGVSLYVPATGDRTSQFALAAAVGIALLWLGRCIRAKRNGHE